MPECVRIALDAMGGDHAPRVNVKGAILALSHDPSLRISLVGIPQLVAEELRSQRYEESDSLRIVAASDAISMDDHAATGIRKRKNSSIHVGLRLVKDKEADAFVSAGNSGAVMAGALLLLGRVGDIERPAIVVKLPTALGFVTVLDVGANVDCKAAHLADFALMGSSYAHFIEAIPSPRVGLISNGSELHKGNALSREAHELLAAQRNFNYIGYIEGYDIFRGKADVVVCDGFVGNVILKTAEGIVGTFIQWFREQLRGNLVGLVGVVLLRRVLRDFRKKFDYQPYGAAPLLGIDGMVLISHGSSSEVAICNGILNAKRGVQENFISKMSGAIIRARAEGGVA